MTRKRLILACTALLALAGAVVLVVWLLRSTPEPDIVEVPLGVEQAVIITTNPDATLEALPYAWGVAVNVRIASMRELESGRVYDIRYIVNRAGEFDVSEYLRLIDGAWEGRPAPFRVRGLERLSKDIEARIAETEDTRIELRAWYYETLTALAVFWIVWLLLLIFWRRRRRTEAAPAPAGPSLAQRIRDYLTQLEAGALDAREQARLELLIFRQWRLERQWADRRMSDSLEAFAADPEVAQAYNELERWLHGPRRSTSPAQVAKLIRHRLERRPAASQAEGATP